MAIFKRTLLIFTLFITTGFLLNTSAHGWDLIAQTNELFAVGTVEGTEKSYLYTIDPATGELTLIGDTMLNNCRGLDFNSEGKLKAFCEVRSDVEVATKGLVAGQAVTVEFNADDAFPEWAVPHGISNNISDITIRDDDVLFSYENLDLDSFHSHIEDNDFKAVFIGMPDIEALDHALGSWGALDLKVAASVEGSPWLFSVDSTTGAAASVGELVLPESIIGLSQSSDLSTRAVAAMQFGSMDAIKLDGRIAGVDIPAANSTRAGIYAFAETDADFGALISAGAEVETSPSNTQKGIVDVWAAIALIDVDTLQVDYVVELQDAPVVVEAIALRPLPLAQVPTLSEWGMIATAVLLMLGALIVLKRRTFVKTS